MTSIFKYGSKWLRFDAHLHTKADKEFAYKGEVNDYANSYISKLKEEDISVGVITNHNKFDLDEYKVLRKKAKKEDMFLLPGIELSVGDGANGIHTLVVFNPDEWLHNGFNFVEQFLSETFAGKEKAVYENENGRSKHDLITTIEKLNSYNKDYFIILAHVETTSGFFKELQGGRIAEFGQNPLFRQNIIGFQKVRTYDEIQKWKQWLEDDLPVFVEGSDPKSIEQIGKGEKSYIKIGDFNFEAVKYALQDKEHRVSKQIVPNENSYIKSIAFDGGKLHGQIINFSASMNNLIGIRGSGKSSVIEAIRYVLDIEFGANAQDVKYKNELIKSLLGSAGKITLIVCDRDGREFEVQKVYGHSTQIKKDNELKNISIDSILTKPLYFGQKDLSSYKEDFENDLISKLIGNKTKNIKTKIESKQQDIKAQLENLKKYDTLEEKKEQTLQKIEELKLKIDEFKTHKIEEKLNKQILFNKDKTRLTYLKKQLKEFTSDIKEFTQNYSEEFFSKFMTTDSKENQDIFDEYNRTIKNAQDEFLVVMQNLQKISNDLSKTDEIEVKFENRFKTLQEEFLKIQREINLPNLRADDFVTYSKNLDTQKLTLQEIEKTAKVKVQAKNKLDSYLSELNELYRQEYKIIQDEIEMINSSQELINISFEFKANKENFEAYLRSVLSGSGLGVNDYKKLCEYADGVEIYKNIESIELGGSKLLSFKEKILNSLASVLTYQVPNKIEIFYKGKELTKHSLGQRASALIIFILTQKENDLIVIDQPEDDLDNQTIYNEVIKELLKLKHTTQFIFATHNANIPVLGDCEQVIVCDYEENSIKTLAGSIDNHTIQNEIINIMEGGDEAFHKRKDIYKLWKH